MSNTMIGVKLADRKFFPVFDTEQPGKKRLVLTTVYDDQFRAQIALVRFRGDAEKRDSGDYPSMGRPLDEQTEKQLDELGVIELQDLPARKHGEPDLDLVLTLDDRGQLDAVATDRLTGNMQSLSVSVYDETVPDESMNDPFRVPASLSDRTLYDERDDDVREDHRRPLVPWLIVALLLLFVGLGFLGYRYLLRPAPAMDQTQMDQTQMDAPPTPSDATAEESPTADAGEGLERAGEVAGAPEQPESRSADSESAESYKILRGDTLWDISERFYGTPWLFPELADRNQIPNPDLIYASNDIIIPRR